MGTAYMRLLQRSRPPARASCRPTPHAATTTSGQVVREEFAALYASVKRDSGASNEELHHFFAEGMLLNVAAALQMGGAPETWSLSGLLEGRSEPAGSGGAT